MVRTPASLGDSSATWVATSSSSGRLRELPCPHVPGTLPDRVALGFLCQSAPLLRPGMKSSSIVGGAVMTSPAMKDPELTLFSSLLSLSHQPHPSSVPLLPKPHCLLSSVPITTGLACKGTESFESQFPHLQAYQSSLSSSN